MSTHSSPPATRFNDRPNFDVLFPPLPRTLIEVSRLIASPLDDASLPALVRAIEFDPLTTTTVLRRVNSAYFGLRQPVSDLPHAVHLLGFHDVCELVMTSAISRFDFALNTPEQKRVFEAIMRLCIGTAYYARLMAQRLELEGKSLVYTVALMSNLGRLVLFYNRMHDYEALWLGNQSSVPPKVHEERLIFGLDHLSLLEQASIVWQLSPEIGEILQHLQFPGHMSSLRLRQVALAVSSAQHACQELLYPVHPAADLAPSSAMHALTRTRGLEAAALISMLIDHQSEGLQFVSTMLDD